MSRHEVSSRYELEPFPVGKGGMGEVFLGRDVRLDREVAVKFIRFPDGERDEELVRRFIRESRITARLEHPGVPAIYDVSTEEARPYLVMERIQGMSVADLIAEHGALPVGWAAAIAAQACAVLSAAHLSSLVHRDLKPANLMLTPDGTVKVLDFGLAVALERSENSMITRTGQSLGTPAYMAPEQVMSGKSAPHTDLYALGATLYEMLAGEPLFTASTPYAVMSRQVNDRPARLRDTRPDVPAELDDLVLAMLAKKAEDRPASADAVYTRLLPFVTGLDPLPGVLHPPAMPSQVRMYSRVVGRIFADTPPRQPAALPAPADEPAQTLRSGAIRRARERAAELVRASRYSEAANVLVQVVSPATRVLRPNDPELVSLRHELANVLFEGGDYRAAGPAYERLATDLATQDADRDLVFRCRLQGATCRALVGDTVTALDRMRELVAEEERAFGDDDPRPLELRRQIGLLELGAGDRDAAVSTLRKVANDLSRRHGPDHDQVRRVHDLLKTLPDRQQ